MWFVFEAEYAIENGRANWNRPVPETMAWHGPFATEAEADEVARAGCGRRSTSTPTRRARST